MFRKLSMTKKWSKLKLELLTMLAPKFGGINSMIISQISGL